MPLVLEASALPSFALGAGAREASAALLYRVLGLAPGEGAAVALALGVLGFVASPCNEVAGACSDTGLPPNTFQRYRFAISRVVGEADAPFDTLRATMGDLPKLPQPPVRGDAYARIRGTREAAETATKAYLAECDPGEAQAASTRAE